VENQRFDQPWRSLSIEDYVTKSIIEREFFNIVCPKMLCMDQYRNIELPMFDFGYKPEMGHFYGYRLPN
jgi:hypothetical protein